MILVLLLKYLKNTPLSIQRIKESYTFAVYYLTNTL